MLMSFTVSRFCPCHDGEIVGDFKGDDPPLIEGKVCAKKYYFKRVMRWDPWTGAYWDEWKIQEK